MVRRIHLVRERCSNFELRPDVGTNRLLQLGKLPEEQLDKLRIEPSSIASYESTLPTASATT